MDKLKINSLRSFQKQLFNLQPWIVIDLFTSLFVIIIIISVCSHATFTHQNTQNIKLKLLIREKFLRRDRNLILSFHSSYILPNDEGKMLRGIFLICVHNARFIKQSISKRIFFECFQRSHLFFCLRLVLYLSLSLSEALDSFSSFYFSVP